MKNDDHRCELNLEYGMLKSAAGYYFGHYCVECGPYSRRSPYFDIEVIDNMSQEELEALKLDWRRDGIEL